MHPFPHHYSVTATVTGDDDVCLTAPGVETISSAGPVEFDGPGNRWSPESLLSAAVADCFVLSFRAIARASRLEWVDLQCDVDGTLDKIDGVTRFTAFAVRARLSVPPGVDPAKADRLLHKAEQYCLVTNSLNATCTLESEVLADEG